MNIKKAFVGGGIATGIALIAFAGIQIAFASLTFNGTSITGSSSTTIDATGTISIGTTSATGITIGNASTTTTIASATTTINNLVVNGTCTGTGCGMPSSTTYEYISALGCPQGADLNTGDIVGSSTPAADAAPCINAALAKATPQHPVVLIQDGASAISGIYGPPGGNWGIEGLGSGVSRAQITQWKIVSDIFYASTTASNNITAGQAVYLALPSGGPAVNSSTVVVSSTGLSATSFEGQLNLANASGWSPNSDYADWYTGTGFYMLAGSNRDVISTNSSTNPTPPQGSNLIFNNFLINGNRGNGYNGDSNTGAYQCSPAWCMDMNIMSMRNVFINNMNFANAPTYGLLLQNVSNVNIDNSNFVPFLPDVPSGVNAPGGFINTDGIHVDSGDDIYISNDYFHTGDDAIALNSNEGLAGPISNVTITNSTCNFCLEMLRIDSGGSASLPVNNVTISNYSGTYWAAIGRFGQSDGATQAYDTINNVTWANSRLVNVSSTGWSWGNGFGIGENVGSLSFDNVEVTGGNGTGLIQDSYGYNYPQYIDSLSLNNVVIARDANGDTMGSLVATNGTEALEIGHLTIDGFKVVDPTGVVNGPLGSVLSLSASSTIGQLNLSNNDFSNVSQVYAQSTVAGVTPLYATQISPFPGSSTTSSVNIAAPGGTGINTPSPQGTLDVSSYGASSCGTGGTVTTTTINGVTYCVNTFDANGAFTPPLGLGSARVLIVGGGGSSGVGYGGGGAGGQLLDLPSVAIPTTSMAVTIGAGGASVGTNQQGLVGGNSTFAGYTAWGGGGGGGGGGGAVCYGTNGANGGGSCGNGGPNVPGQGLFPSIVKSITQNIFGLFNEGGAGTASASASGGGAGCGGPGGNATIGLGGVNGIGILDNITGVSTWYCAGGTGDGATPIDGGNANYVSGAAGTGSGGGAEGPAGGSGIVVINYPLVASKPAAYFRGDVDTLGLLDMLGSSSTVRIGTGSTNPGCIELYDTVNSTLMYIYSSSSTLVETSTPPLFCQ